MLVVAEDAGYAQELANGLGDQGFQTITADTGRMALDRAAEADAVLLDIVLPDLDAFDVCRSIRAASTIPIIIMSGRCDEFDRVLGLKMGADDYVVKPYGLRELAARFEAVVRRAAPVQPSADVEVREMGAVRVDTYCRRVTVDDLRVTLTRKEFDLLVLLTGEPGRVFGRSLIMREVWGHDGFGDTRTLGVHVAGLRKKLGVPRVIETVRGVGFRFAA